MSNRFLLCLAFLLATLTASAAVADGTWTQSANGSGPHTLILQTSGTGLSGTLDGAPLSGGKTEGAFVWFTANRGSATYSYKGQITNGKLVLSETHTNGTGHQSYTFLKN